MKKIWALLLSVALLVTVLCVGTIPAKAAITGTFVDTIVPEFAIPEIVDYSAFGTTEAGTQGHRIAVEANPDLGATLLIKQDNDRNPEHTEYITYKMAKGIAGFEFKVMCCAGLGNPLEQISVFISKTGAEGSWAQVSTQATRYTFNPDIYIHFDKAYWHESTLMNAQTIPSGYKYLKIQFNGCTGSQDVPWNVAIDTVTIFMGSNVAVPVIPEDQTFLTYEELAKLPTTEPTEPTTPSEPTTPPTEPTTPSEPSQPEDPVVPAYTPGDVNNDTKVNLKDLGVLQQYLNGWDVAINAAAANVTGDDKVNLRDLGVLQQFLNGWDVELKPSAPVDPGDPDEPVTPPTAPTAPSDEPTNPPTEPTATVTAPSGEPTTPSQEPTAPPTKTTTSRTEPTFTEPSTPPTAPSAPAVDMPAAGYDLDGKGRIVVYSSTVNGSTATFVFKNVSKENGKEWIIPEYSRVSYACMDANGVKLSNGSMTLGALDGGDRVTCSISLPEGTAKVVFTGHNLEYWTPWA